MRYNLPGGFVGPHASLDYDEGRLRPVEACECLVVGCERRIEVEDEGAGDRRRVEPGLGEGRTKLGEDAARGQRPGAHAEPFYHGLSTAMIPASCSVMNIPKLPPDMSAMGELHVGHDDFRTSRRII